MNLFRLIKERASIVDVISEYTALKKAGAYYKGCCPFHHEKSPSFTVTPDKEIFYCFGCHVGGDVISFIAKSEQCSQLEAAKQLAERFNIALPENISFESSRGEQDAQKRYHATCATFKAWCSEQLHRSQTAQDYLTKRGISADSIGTFGIGYCSQDLKGLLAYAQKEGILAQDFLDAHIIKENRRGLYLAFDERILFPITTHKGDPVGFGGRVFTQGDTRAKYYNSQEHSHFSKSTLLFGLSHAKKSIAANQEVFLVEGYTDLVMMHQAGYTNCVATLGTACTKEHLQLLARYAEKLYVVYDSDTAGQQAIMRLAELCFHVSLDLYVITLPAGEDPDSYIAAHGALDGPKQQAEDIFSFAVHRITDAFEDKSLKGKMAATQKLLDLIAPLEPLKRDLLLQQASAAFKVPISTLVRGMQRTPKKRADTPPAVVEPSATEEVSPLESQVICAILSEDVLTQDDIDLFTQLLDGPLEAIITTWKTLGGKQIDVSTLITEVDEPHKALLSRLVMEQHDRSLTTEQFGLVLKKRWKKKVHDVKRQIEAAERAQDKEQVALLLNELTTLKKKLVARGIA